MNWEEACKYIWSGPLTRRHYQYKVENGRVFWNRIGDPEDIWSPWRLSSSSVESTLIDTGYKIVENNPNNAHITREEKICKKVKLMEKRWLSFQERKHDVQCRG